MSANTFHALRSALYIYTQYQVSLHSQAQQDEAIWAPTRIVHSMLESGNERDVVFRP